MNMKKGANFVFFGTSDFSVEVLNSLKKNGFIPSLIITTPDSKSGRGLKINESEVSLWAKKEEIPILKPENFDEEFISNLKTKNHDLFVVASYGKIIPKIILSIPKHGSLNVHPSLLPKYRGATPIPSQILNDDKKVGVTLILIDEEVDHGPIVSQKEVTLDSWPKKSSELKKILAKEGGEASSKIIEKFIQGEIEIKDQNHKEATFTKKIDKADGKISLEDDPYKNYLKFCAYEDTVGTYFFKKKDENSIRVKIKEAQYKEGNFKPLLVTPEGGKEMSYEDFLRGF